MLVAKEDTRGVAALICRVEILTSLGRGAWESTWFPVQWEPGLCALRSIRLGVPVAHESALQRPPSRSISLTRFLWAAALPHRRSRLPVLLSLYAAGPFVPFWK